MRFTGRLTAALAMLAGGAVLAEDVKPVGDTEFVTKAASGGLFEVESSKLAKEAATSPEAKKFAERMIADHEKANEKLKGAAKKAGIEVPAKMSAEHQKLLDRVKAAKGGDFDKAYMAAQVAAHDEAVVLFPGQPRG